MNKEFISILALLGPTYALTAHAEIYMSEEKAASVIFPGLKFNRIEVELTSSEIEKIGSLSGEKVRTKKIALFRSSTRELVFIDQALGKHEFITYAIGVDRNGKVAGIEILDYRESFGHQIRRPQWRGQFLGKDLSSKFKLDEDIKNISGATLSCAHITTGVKRILHTYELIRTRI